MFAGVAVRLVTGSPRTVKYAVPANKTILWKPHAGNVWELFRVTPLLVHPVDQTGYLYDSIPSGYLYDSMVRNGGWFISPVAYTILQYTFAFS
jgi:hypothetical protein